MKAGYEALTDLIGYGELSGFGDDVITKIFNRFKRNKQYKDNVESGLRLWDFNKFLRATETNTLFDAVEYRNLLDLFGVLVDNENSLRVEGLKNYYLRNGRLSIDNSLIGVGSLNEFLQGKLKVSLWSTLATLSTLIPSPFDPHPPITSCRTVYPTHALLYR